MGAEVKSWWVPMSFKGTRVYIRCSPDGEPIVTSGRVDIRYKANAAKVYRGSTANLAPLDSPEPPETQLSDGEPSSPKAGAKAKKASSRANAGRNRRPGAGGSAEVTPPREGSVVVYTDGACSGNPGPTGSGAVVVDGETTTEISAYLGKGTNNIGELTAIQLGLEGIEDRTRAVDLYTDSDYAIGVLTRGWKAKANKELIAGLRDIVNSFEALEIHWIPGHAGVDLNERADELARQAISARRTETFTKSTPVAAATPQGQ